MEYPYLEVAPGFLAPIVPIEFLAKERKIYSLGYVDSGATLSVFQMKMARSLGLSEKKGKRMEITVGDGDKLPLLVYNLKIRFSNHTFYASIGFSDRLGVGFNIIGRSSFFERFRICFNDHDKMLSTLRLY